MYVSGDMSSNFIPSIIVLSVMHNMRVMNVIHVYSHRTSPPVYFVLGVVRVMRVMHVKRVVRSGPLSRYRRCSE